MGKLFTTWLKFKFAEIALLILALLIHDAYVGSLIDIALMGTVILDVAFRIPTD